MTLSTLCWLFSKTFCLGLFIGIQGFYFVPYIPLTAVKHRSVCLHHFEGMCGCNRDQQCLTLFLCRKCRERPEMYFTYMT